MRIEESDTVRLNILSKTNIELQVKFTDLKALTDQVAKIGSYLTEKMGLSFHPCPKTYSLFVVMRGRMKARTVNELLNKFWYPTFEFSDINLGEGTAKAIIAIPPVLPEYLASV